MKFYAEVPSQRTRQLLWDGVVLLWLYLWVRLGVGAYRLIDKLQGPGRSIEDVGASYGERFDDVGDAIGRVPVAGGGLRRPFEAIADGSRALERAGATQQDLVHDLALWAGLLLALVPIVWALARYLPGRVRWVREATAANRLRVGAADLGLFALRAAATRPLHELARVCDDPAAALAARDYLPLATLELEGLGLRVRPAEAPLR